MQKREETVGVNTNHDTEKTNSFGSNNLRQNNFFSVNKIFKVGSLGDRYGWRIAFVWYLGPDLKEPPDC